MPSSTSAFNRPPSAAALSARRAPRARRCRLIIAIFILCITLPAIVGMTGITLVPEFTENRTLNPMPRLGSDPQSFLRGLDGYISDRFGFRPLLITAVNYGKFLLGVSAHPLIVVGKDGWLFLNCDCRRPTAGFPADTIAKYEQVFVERDRWVKAQHAHFTFFIAPRKDFIYPEYLPDRLTPVSAVAPGDMLRDELGRQGVDVLYPKQAFLADKQKAKLFFQYDAHWTEAGAFYGARELINHLHDLDPRVPRFAESDFAVNSPGPKCFKKYDGSRLDLMVLQGGPALSEACPIVTKNAAWTATQQSVPGELVYTKDDPSLPTAVFYVDSFGIALHRFVAEYFRHSIFINPWGNPQRSDEFPTAPILDAKPDFVVYLRTETNVFQETDNPSDVKKIMAEPER